MRTAVILLIAGMAAGEQGSMPAPDTAEQQAIWTRIREWALGFTGGLADFTCIQTNVRSVDPSGKGHWKPLETQEIEVTYTGRKEHYKTLTIDGKPVGTGKRVRAGYYTPSGEFGTVFHWVFDEQAKAQFEWERGFDDGGKRTCMFRYRVPVETTNWVMTANLDTVRMAHRGWVEADCASGAIARIHMESDPATTRQHGRDVAVGAKMDVRYGPVSIGGKEFQLPQEADEIGIYYTSLTRVQIQFRQYKKYDSRSTITYGDPKQ